MHRPRRAAEAYLRLTTMPGETGQVDCGHYRYEPRPVAPARGNEKGRVERAIRYVRDSFCAARTFADMPISTRR
jgi:hypothetical protein